MTLPVQIATIPEFCPVCSESPRPGKVVAAVLGAAHAIEIPCPHCTDPGQLMNLLEGRREEAV